MQIIIYRMIFIVVMLLCSLDVFALDFRASMKKYHVPNVAIAYINNSDIKIQYEVLDEKLDVKQERSIFQIASLSKTLFAVAIIKWAQISDISLDTSLKTLKASHDLLDLPEKLLNVSLFQLLSHTSGIPQQNFSGYCRLECCPKLADSINCSGPLQQVLHIDLSKQRKFLYSGANYALLQYVIEEVTKLDFDKFMRKYLFEPWKIETFFPTQDISQYDSLAQAHNMFGRSINSKFYCQYAAAGMIATIQGMALFVKRILEPSNKWIRDIMIGNGSMKYGLGIEIEKIGGHDLLYHLGANFGWRSSLYLFPKLNQGIVILTNSDSGFFLSTKIVDAWVRSLGLPSPSILCLAKKEESFVCYGIILLLLVCVSRLALLLYQVRTKVRFKRQSFGVFRPSLLIILFAIVWYLVFYTQLLPPSGWVVASFLPYNFIYFSSSIFAIIVVESIYRVYPKSKQR